MPILLGIACLINNVIWWKAAVLTVGLVIGTSLPYGDSLKQPWEPLTWLLRLLVLSTYTLATAVLGWTPWQVITPLLMTGLFYISTVKWGEKLVPWKLWEGLQFYLVGYVVGILLCK